MRAASLQTQLATVEASSRRRVASSAADAQLSQGVDVSISRGLRPQQFSASRNCPQFVGGDVRSGEHIKFRYLAISRPNKRLKKSRKASEGGERGGEEGNNLICSEQDSYKFKENQERRQKF